MKRSTALHRLAEIASELERAKAAARTDQIEFVEPSDDNQLVAQLRIERDLGRRHLEATAGQLS